MTTSETFSFCITSSHESFTNLLADIPEERAQLKPSTEKWSVLECVEHIFLVEKPIVKLLTKPGGENWGTEESMTEKFGADKMRHILSNRERKFQAPDLFTPKNTFSSLAEAKTAVTALRTNLLNALKEGKVKFTAETFPHPVMGDFTRLDWVNFLVEHAGRHYQQLEEIKLSTGRPVIH